MGAAMLADGTTAIRYGITHTWSDADQKWTAPPAPASDALAAYRDEPRLPSLVPVDPLLPTPPPGGRGKPK